LLIATGRQTVAPAIAVRRMSAGRTFTVQIQDPTVDPRHFDLVVVPAHDGLAGDNVVTTLGALHRVTPARLAAAADRFRDRYAGLKRPLVAVLLGGDNRQYILSDEAAGRLADGLVRLVRDSGAGIAVTPSRRTGAKALAIIGDRLRTLAPGAWDIWDGSGDNPYFAMLALADAIVVTGDSVNMVSEACAAAKPVHVFDLDGGSAKFERFHAGMRARGLTRRFEGRLERWRVEPPDDVARVVAEIRRRMRWPEAGLGQSDAVRRAAGRRN
jgi:mitochondrial fission protein ELM1